MQRPGGCAREGKGSTGNGRRARGGGGVCGGLRTTRSGELAAAGPKGCAAKGPREGGRGKLQRPGVRACEQRGARGKGIAPEGEREV